LEDSAQKEAERRQQKMEYPTWWAKEEDIQRGYKDHGRSKVDPNKAKVNKNYVRYAEDSLDARIRHVQ
jgi:hypothetical protein